MSLSRRPGSGLDVDFAPLQFDDVPALVESLRGAGTLYNTYWIRFEHGATTFARAVENTRTLFRAALEAGVTRIVHVSVTNASHDSPYPYFRGKAQVETDLRELEVAHTIVRPTLVFGPENFEAEGKGGSEAASLGTRRRSDDAEGVVNILVNNIAWILRRFPLFPVPGAGDYRVQPVAVEDVAELAVAAEGGVVDAAGPDTFAFEELVRLVGRAVGSRARLVHAPAGLALALTHVGGRLLRDVVLTGDELRGLMDSLLVSAERPRGTRSFGDWLSGNFEAEGKGDSEAVGLGVRRRSDDAAGGVNGQTLGRRYVSELERNWR